jgi:signal transduction histidine kinase
MPGVRVSPRSNRRARRASTIVATVQVPPLPKTTAPVRRGDLTLTGFLASALAAAAIAGGSWQLSVQQAQAHDRIGRSHEVLAAIAGTRADLAALRNGQSLAVDLARLRELTADNPVQQQHVRAFEEQLASADGAMPAPAAGLGDALRRMETEESRQLARARDEHQDRLRAFWLALAALLAGLFTALSLLYLQVRRRKAAERVALESEQQARTLELQQSNEALRAAKERLQALSSRLISAQEEERRHIARELHDETGQALTLIRMQLAELAALHPQAQADVAGCTQHVDRAISHIRGLSLRLRPPMLDDLGLADALEWVVEQQSRAAGWQASLALDEVEKRLPDTVETACFRICQEALTNAARYARATEIRVSLHQSGAALELAISDNGTGFDLARYRTPEERKKHFGLVSMSERASLAGGRLDIATAPGHGTRICALFELQGRGGQGAGPVQALPA